MDRQSEAYRNMTLKDIVEKMPNSTVYGPCESLDDIKLPDDYPQEDGYGTPKDLAKAEGALFERIMDPTAPDSHSEKGVYVRMRFKEEA